MAESLAEKKARGHQPPDSFCWRAAPTCVLEASVTSNTSADGEKCVKDTAEERADLALTKASCNSRDQLPPFKFSFGVGVNPLHTLT